MCAPSPPAPPDPQDTAAAATGTNIATATANTIGGQVDQVTPYGNLTYDQTGTYSYTDPYTGESYDIPRFRATTTLNDQQTATLDETQRAQYNLAGTAADQSSFLRDYLGQPANFDTSAIEGRLTDLGRQQLDPRFERERADLSTRLANQGIAPGSEAYNREMDALNQSSNQAYNDLYLRGRGQAFGELAAQRNQPINEITALLSGSQVTQPNVSMSTPQGAATTDVAGLINQNYNQRYNNWQQQAASQQGLMGGLFGLGASAITGGLF